MIADSTSDPAFFAHLVARHWEAARKARRRLLRHTDTSLMPPMHAWIDETLLPGITAALPEEDRRQPGVAILAVLVHLSQPRMGPPPEAFCTHALRLAEEAAIASGAAAKRKEKRDTARGSIEKNSDEGTNPSFFTTPLPWLAWMLVATGSGAWRHPQHPAIEGPWGKMPWPEAITELEIMAADSIFRTLWSQFPTVPGFAQWLRTEVGSSSPAAEKKTLRSIATEAAVSAVQGFTQRIGAAVAPTYTRPAKRRSKRESYRYLRDWDVRKGTLPFWVSCVLRGYAVSLPHGSATGAAPSEPVSTFVSTGLPNIFARGWAFEAIAGKMPVFHARTALQPCRACETRRDKAKKQKGARKSEGQVEVITARRPIFWQDRCDNAGCQKRLREVIEEYRFVMRPACGEAFFFRCKCKHYTFFSRYVEEPPSVERPAVEKATSGEDPAEPEAHEEMEGAGRDALLANLVARIEEDETLSASPLDIGDAVRKSLDARTPDTLLIALSKWLLSRFPVPGKRDANQVLGDALDMTRKALEKDGEIDASSLGLEMLDHLIGILAGVPEIPCEPEPQKSQKPRIKRPAGLRCSLCEKPDHVSARSTLLWMCQPPPAGAFESRATSDRSE